MTATSQANDLDSIIERIDSIADHGQALALSLVANDHFRHIHPNHVAAMLDDLQGKFKAIKTEIEKCQ